MGRQIHLLIRYKSTYGTRYRIETLRTWALWRLRRPHCVKYELILNFPMKTFSVDTPFPVRFLNISALKEIPVFYAVSPPLTFLLKTLHCSYVNCNGFHKHERLFLIMVQQVPKRWNITLNLSEKWNTHENR